MKNARKQERDCLNRGPVTSKHAFQIPDDDDDDDRDDLGSAHDRKVDDAHGDDDGEEQEGDG